MTQPWSTLVAVAVGLSIVWVALLIALAAARPETISVTDALRLLPAEPDRTPSTNTGPAPPKDSTPSDALPASRLHPRPETPIKSSHERRRNSPIPNGLNHSECRQYSPAKPGVGCHRLTRAGVRDVDRRDLDRRPLAARDHTLHLLHPAPFRDIFGLPIVMALQYWCTSQAQYMFRHV